jgi:hypothetical protein
MEDRKEIEQNSKNPSQYEELHYQKYHRGSAEYDLMMITIIDEEKGDF